MNNASTCPGCGLKLKSKSLSDNKRFNASGACFELFNELSGYTLSNNDERFVHQLVVDAYGAQHAGSPTKNITVIFALIGLCLVVEHGYTGHQVQLLHMRIPKQEWPKLKPPHKKVMTIKDVLSVSDYHQMEILIYSWVKSVWALWEAQHNYIRQLVNNYIKN